MRHLEQLEAVLVGWLVLPGSSVALACPDCALGRATRALVWNQNFLFNAAVSLAPFLLIAAASVWANRIGRPRS